MRYSNIHTHTTFSDGIGSVRENIESAIAKNMVSLGISDHSYTYCNTSYCIKKDAYGDYFKTVNALKKEYSEKIDVLLGLELDYYSKINTPKIALVHGDFSEKCKFTTELQNKLFSVNKTGKVICVNRSTEILI